MTISRKDLRDLAIAQTGATNPLIDQFMLDVEPLLALADAGGLPVAPTAGDPLALDDERRTIIDRALQKALRLPSCSVVGFSLAEPELFKMIPADMVAVRLTRVLMEQRRAECVAAMGEDAFRGVVQPLWDCIGEQLTRATVASCQDALDPFDFGVVADIIYGPLVLASYAFLYASHGMTAEYAEVRDLLLLLPQVVPMGSPDGASDSWIVLMA